MESRKSTDLYYAAWPTAWGPMGAAMNARGLTRIVLPHYQLDDLLQLLAWEHSGAVRDEKPFESLVQLTRGYFNGRGVDFGEISCDLPAKTTLTGAVYRQCRLIPYGQRRSYTWIAEGINRPDSARAVAAALGRNPIPPVIPCHRVTYADGRLGGFSALGGVDLKKRMLDFERGKL